MKFFKLLIKGFKWLGQFALKMFGNIANAVKICIGTTIFFSLFVGMCSYVAPLLIGVEKSDAYIIGVAIAMVTFGITIWMYDSLKSFMPKSKEDEYKYELEKLNKKIEESEQCLSVKIGENAKLRSEMETMKQAQLLVPKYSKERNLQLFKISKSGYVVKEEELFSYKDIEHDLSGTIKIKFSDNFPKKIRVGWMDTEITKDDNWRVFYSDNEIYEYEIGIKLEEIQYTIDPISKIVYFQGVKLSRLNRIHNTTHLNIANHVWIVKRDNKGQYKIMNELQHNDFKVKYRTYQRDITDRSIRSEIDDKLCELYTNGLHEILTARYGDKIRFVKDCESGNFNGWKPLSETNVAVETFISDLYLAFDTMKLCANNNKALDEAIEVRQIGA